uniref:Uncharacterized protein n=1 Tax=Panagrolaimus davidi TaxID=227884 RepID=A0A914R9K9_9BILA
MNSAEQTSNDFAPYKSSSAQQITTAPPPPQLKVSKAFHHQDSKYKCWSFHAKTSAMILAIIYSTSFWYLINGFIGFINDDEKRWSDWAEWIILILLIPGVICLFVGLFTKNQYLLIPYTFHAIFFAIFYVIRVIIYIYIFSNAEPNDIQEAKKRMGLESFNVSNGVIIGAAILYIIHVLLSTACYIWVIFRCYGYFRDLKNFSGQTFIGPEP